MHCSLSVLSILATHQQPSLVLRIGHFLVLINDALKGSFTYFRYIVVVGITHNSLPLWLIWDPSIFGVSHYWDQKAYKNRAYAGDSKYLDDAEMNTRVRVSIVNEGMADAFHNRVLAKFEGTECRLVIKLGLHFDELIQVGPEDVLRGLESTRRRGAYE